MRVLILSWPGTPIGQYPGGMPLVFMSILQDLCRRGIDSSFIALAKPGQYQDGVAVLPVEMQGRVQSHYFPAHTEEFGIERAVSDFAPDFILASSAHAASIASGVSLAPVIALHYGDRGWARRRCELRYGSWRDKFRAVQRLRVTARRLKEERGPIDADAVITFAAYTSVRGHHYSPMPIADVTAPLLRRGGGPYLMVGSLTSSSGVASVMLLRSVVAPIAARLGRVVRVIGKGPEVRGPGIEHLGWITAARLRDEYEACTAAIVPCPFGEQAYSKVVDGFRCGVPQIIHRVEKRVFPELQHGRNCLLASSSREWREALETPPSILQSCANVAQHQFKNQFEVRFFVDRLLTIAAELKVST